MHAPVFRFVLCGLAILDITSIIQGYYRAIDNPLYANIVE